MVLHCVFRNITSLKCVIVNICWLYINSPTKHHLTSWNTTDCGTPSHRRSTTCNAFEILSRWICQFNMWSLPTSAKNLTRCWRRRTTTSYSDQSLVLSFFSFSSSRLSGPVLPSWATWVIQRCYLVQAFSSRHVCHVKTAQTWTVEHAFSRAPSFLTLLCATHRIAAMDGSHQSAKYDARLDNLIASSVSICFAANFHHTFASYCYAQTAVPHQHH